MDKQLSVPTSPNASLNMSFEEKMDVDNRSVYIGEMMRKCFCRKHLMMNPGNVDYGATAEELEQHFHGCGSINRVNNQPIIADLAEKLVNLLTIDIM